MTHSVRRIVGSFALALILGITVSECARAAASAAAAQKTRARVLLVGVDAGEWDVLGPLMDRGKCPNFARMRKQGSSGKLRSLEPLARSPVIWASIATGKIPKKHGILDFFTRTGALEIGEDPREGVPVQKREGPTTSNLWKARAIWKILSGLGRTVGVVGWWTTWPAHRVNGTLVSDYVQYRHGSKPYSDPQSTYPESLGSVVERLRVKTEDVTWAELFQFIPAIDTTKVTARQKELVKDLRWIYAADMTFYRVGLELYRKKRPDFFTVYLRGLDEACHMYWDTDVMNERLSSPLTKAEKAWLEPLIPNYYVFVDRLLGDYLKISGKDTDVIVVSDHGFGGGGQGVRAHKLDGIVFMMGPHVPKGATISGATVLDVTPTVLTLFGLPTARDMDGRPISSGIEPKLAKRMERDTRLQTYETARAPGESEEPLRSPVDEELRERLRSLGYIQ